MFIISVRGAEIVITRPRLRKPGCAKEFVACLANTQDGPRNSGAPVTLGQQNQRKFSYDVKCITTLHIFFFRE